MHLECMKKRKLSEDPETPEPKKQVKMATEDKTADKITTAKVEAVSEVEKKSDAVKIVDEKIFAETKNVEKDKTEEKENGKLYLIFYYVATKWHFLYILF